MMQSFTPGIPTVQPNETEKAYFRERVTFFANCFVLCNYNLSGKGSYRDNQVKVNLNDHSLYNACTLSFDRAFKWAISPIVDNLVRLPQTVVVIQEVADKIFEETFALGSLIEQSEKNDSHMLQRFNAHVHASLYVLRGVKIMNNTYQKHYSKNDPEHEGLKELYETADSFTQKKERLTECYKKVGLQLKELSISDVNHFLTQEAIYYDNLDALCQYHYTGKMENRPIQISKLEQKQRLASWKPNTLKHTTPIIKKVCDRASHLNVALFHMLKTAKKTHASHKKMIIAEIKHTLDFALPGVLRMEQSSKEHPHSTELKELKTCAAELCWIESLRFQLGLYTK